jgi:hypothetical protein
MALRRGIAVNDAAGAAPTGGTAGDMGAGTVNVAGSYYINGADVGAGHLPGTQTNDNAAAGQVGEYITSDVVSPGANLPSVTATVVTSISLTAGDWDVEGVAVVSPAGTTVITTGPQCWVGIGTTSPPVEKRNQTPSSANYPAGQIFSMLAPRQRFSLSSPTTINLVCFAGVTVSTATTYGQIQARRVR